MRTSINIACFAISILGLVSFVQAEMEKAPIYRPSDPNAPVVRVDGHVRGADAADLTITVLAPEHVGTTVKEQPCLYWYQSKSAKNRFELTISQSKKADPIVEVVLEPMKEDGIRRFCLAQYNVKLEQNVEYRWSVAMVLDPANRSKDIVASGVIKRIAPPENLHKRLAEISQDKEAFVYADEGLWYDSLQALSEQIERRPQEKRYREQRAVFFMQVGLSDAALHELRKASVGVSELLPDRVK
jgi:hypothetical protein